MNELLLAAVLSGAAGSAAPDYRDCRELFVYATGVKIPETKPIGTPWDDGSGPDIALRTRPAGRSDLLAQDIGPKLQDSAAEATWTGLNPADARGGKWLPIRVGDSLELWLSDLDAFADDSIAKGSFEVPKEVAKAGFGVFAATMGGSTVWLAVSAHDGKRSCAGLDGSHAAPSLAPNEGVVARADRDAFDAIRVHNKCNINGKTAACNIESYRARFIDVNKDGTLDMLVVGGPFATDSTSKVVALWLGFDVKSRKQLFLGDCDEIGILSKSELTCTSGGKTSVISYSGKGEVREASAKELAQSNAVTGAERAREAQSNLLALFTAQRSFYQETDRYSTNLVEIGFAASRGNRYSYFAAAHGTPQSRKTESINNFIPHEIVLADEYKHPGIAVASGIKDAGCPLTFGLSADGEPIGIGVTGKAPMQEFIAYAAGNLDDDADFDCWSIASVKRTTKDGFEIPAGLPFHEKSDYATGASAALTE